MAFKTRGQIFSLTTIAVAGICSMGIALQLTVHARDRLIKKEATEDIIQWTQYLNTDIEDIKNIAKNKAEGDLDLSKRKKLFSGPIFSISIFDKDGRFLAKQTKTESGIKSIPADATSPRASASPDILHTCWRPAPHQGGRRSTALRISRSWRTRTCWAPCGSSRIRRTARPATSGPSGF